MFAIEFEKIEWESPAAGARFKAYERDGIRMRIVEFTEEFSELHWCESGHMGLVLKGELEIDFNGHIVRYPEGSGIFIQPGTGSAHKARSLTACTRLFLVENA